MAVLSPPSVVTAAIAPNGQLFGQINRIPTSSSSIPQLLVFRGGGADSDEEYDSDEYDSEYDSDEEEEEEEPIVTKAKKLATSTKSATQKKALKQTAVKNAALKSKVSVAMASSSSSKAVTKKKGVYKRFVPYIVRACLNPFTLVAMTKAYFVSLLDINYLNKEVSEQRMFFVCGNCHDNNQIYVYSVSLSVSFLEKDAMLKRLACVEFWNIEHPTRQPTQFLCRCRPFGVFAVLKAAFMNYPNALDFSCVWIFRNVRNVLLSLKSYES